METANAGRGGRIPPPAQDISARREGSPDGSKSRWWIAPVAGTCVAAFAGAVFFVFFTLSGFAFDECNPPVEKICPATTHAQRLADCLLLTALVTTGLQWLLAYWLPGGLRRLAATIPSVFTIAAIIVLAQMPVGR